MNISDDFYCPEVVRGEYNVLKHQISEFLMNTQKGYADVIPFLSQEKKHLDSVRAKIGKDAEPYIMMSSFVVNACLVKIIPAINDEQERLDRMGAQYDPLHYDEFRKLKDIATTSWNAYKIMDRMAMEYQFKEEQYLPSRATLKKICAGMGLDARDVKEKFSDHLEKSLDPDNGCLGIIITRGIIVAILFVVLWIIVKACS